ncbi:unnamed protein product [Mytilus coruscus]|uniref:Endonuclease/exonuclease/phosphatase domain-containing protein n=1 Tax=Mytilus coruscus TaxID=42192 RepID=A0A6J8BIN3_MYTCO|nr:unnamed protein product [Mytilus coruscus]
MSFAETTKILAESRKVIEDGQENNTATLLTLILSVVTSVEKSIKKIESGMESIEKIKTTVTLLSADLRTLTKNLKDLEEKKGEPTSTSLIVDNSNCFHYYDINKPVLNVNKTKLKSKIDEVDQTENIDNQNVIDKNENMTTDSFHDTNVSFDTENLDMSNSGFKSRYPDMLNILSLNCCGIIKKLQYPEFETLLRNHDIICLVETKLDDRDEIKLPGYILKFKNRKKIAKVKSGGILLGYKQKYEHFIEVIDTGSKFVFWFKISSKLMNTDTDAVFGIVYIPPEYTSYASWDAFSQIENEFLDLSSRYELVSLVGDFNGRTASEKDFLIFDSHDPSNNFSDLIENNFCTLEVVDFSKLFSDVHCPLSISVYATNVDGCEVPDYIEESVERIRKWDSDKLIEFQQNINQGKIKDLLYNLKEPRVDVNVNIHVEKLCEILIESAKATFGISHSKNGKTRQKSFMNKPWFNRECKFARQNYRKFRRKFKINRTTVSRSNLAGSENIYKKTLDKNHRLYRQNLSKKLKELRTKNSREYWKVLNQGKRKKQPDIPIEKLFDFFKDLNASPTDDNGVDLPPLDEDQVNHLNYDLNLYIEKEKF